MFSLKRDKIWVNFVPPLTNIWQFHNQKTEQWLGISLKPFLLFLCCTFSTNYISFARFQYCINLDTFVHLWLQLRCHPTYHQDSFFLHAVHWRLWPFLWLLTKLRRKTSNQKRLFFHELKLVWFLVFSTLSSWIHQPTNPS